METKDIILELRNRAGLSQDELAEKVYVTRQAVSRWENGETIPNIETLKLLSKLFDVSINTLLGSPRKFKWCYVDGEYTYKNMNCWKRYAELGGDEKFDQFKRKLIEEINELHVEGMPELTSLNALVGGYVNLEYRLPNGAKIKFLDDEETYLGNQLECKFSGDRCFGIVANMDFILVCAYEENGADPELIIYKKR